MSREPSQAPSSSSGGKGLWVLGGVAIAAAAFFVLRPASEAPDTPAEDSVARVAPAPQRVPAKSDSQGPAAKPAAQSVESALGPAEPVASADRPATDAETKPDSDAPAEDAKQDAPSEAERASDPGELREVTLHIFPLEGKIYHKGNVIGTGSAKVKVAPGEKELLLVLLDGYHPRKVILDGAHASVNVGLVRQKDAAPINPTRPAKGAAAPRQ